MPKRIGMEVALDDIPAPALVADRDGRVTAANARCEALLGRPVAGEPLTALFSGATQVEGRKRVVGHRAGSVPFTAEVQASPRRGGGIVMVVTEVAGGRLLGESARMMDIAFDGVPLGMALYNTNGEFIRVNAAMCALLGRSPDELLGERDQELTHPEDREKDLVAARRILAGELSAFHCEKRFLRPDGTIAWALANLVFLRDEAGNPLCWVGTFQDITTRRRSEHRLRHLADHDPLTGVANRRRLVTDLELHVAHAGRANERGAVLLLDLDGFKAVNDTQGHDAGDEVLRAVAIGLRARLRVTDSLGRWGGDEFAVVLPHVDYDGARVVAEELIASVRDSAPAGVTASCGVALYGPEANLTADELLARADRAMYAAKHGGRDAVSFSDPAASSSLAAG